MAMQESKAGIRAGRPSRRSQQGNQNRLQPFLRHDQAPVLRQQKAVLDGINRSFLEATHVLPNQTAATSVLA
jgi:hypothetical protein